MNMQRFLMTIPALLLERLHEHKRVTGVPMSETIRRALELYFDHQEERHER